VFGEGKSEKGRIRKKGGREMKTRNCAVCIFARYLPNGKWDETFSCAKGHKPRFYQSANTVAAMEGDYGYKRKCEDYKEGK
jgi:hypothetical protein